MSNFACPVCGAIISDPEKGFGCEHYPADIKEEREMSEHEKIVEVLVRLGLVSE